MHWPYQEQLQLEQRLELEVWKTHSRKAYPKASHVATLARLEQADVKNAASPGRVRLTLTNTW